MGNQAMFHYEDVKEILLKERPSIICFNNILFDFFDGYVL